MKSLRKKFKGQYFRKGIIYFLSWCLVVNTFLPAAMAEVVLQPDGIINGDITVTPLDGGTTQSMTATNGAIGHFSDFDIAAGHTVTLTQTGGSNPNALFRVFSGDGTQILGQFDANGNVFLIDAAGILFGADSVINVNQLVASSLDISNEDFLAGNYEFLAGDGALGTVVNEGTINTIEGAALIGKRIVNTGTITTGEGGFVVMAAGDRVLLGEPGSHVLVEMNSVEDPEEGEGEVINDGDITAPAGTVVMASGDVFASALELPKVSSGTGRVEQNGVVDVDGITTDGGSISLTAADEVVLASGSLTSANAGTVSDAGLIVAHSLNRTTIEAGSEIQATGGHDPEPGAGGFDDSVNTTVEITGDYVNLAGNIDASATGGKRGKIVIDALNIGVVNGAMPVDPPDNTVYEQWIEEQTHLSNSTDVELVAHSKDAGTIIVGTLADGEITGGSGDIVMRTKYDTGGIAFFGGSGIHTTDGGNVYMLAGEDGITVGDITTDVPAPDKITEPGKIRLLTTNEGDITTGNLSVDGGSYVEISVIADGDLTVNGDVHTITNQVPSDTQEIGQARTCLVSEHGDVLVNGTIAVEGHGKNESNADIHIDAGENITINLDGGQIRATAKTSQTGPAYASVLMHAGTDIEGPGTILITDDGENPTARANAIFIDTKGGGGSDSAEISSNGDPADSRTETDNSAEATLDIDEDRTETCDECPTPPGLIPPLDPWAYVTHMNTTTSGDVLTDDTLSILDHTEPSHGTLILNSETGEYEYTPDEGFVGQDRFAYQAVTEEGVETDWVEVTIDIINELPVTSPTSGTEHMGIPITDVLNTNDVSDGLGIDDLTINIVDGPEHGNVTIEWDGEQWVYTYTPEVDAEGNYFAGTETFTYSVADGQLDGEGNPIEILGTVEIMLLNNPPVQTEDIVTVGQGQDSVVIDVLANDYDPDYPEYMDNLTVVQDSVVPQHGQLILNDDNTFTYIPDIGYVGQDTFTYGVLDGQKGQQIVWTTVTIWVNASVLIPAAPLPAPIDIEVSGCPALVKWAAAELGTDQKTVQIWVARALASPGNIQPCDACTSLKDAATVLQDADGTRLAALANVVDQFASSDAPPTEEQMASIADAIANDLEGNAEYAAAGEYLDALAKYVGILNNQLGFSADQAVQFATNNYVEKLADGENINLATYVAARLSAMGGSQ